jgi:glycosyltransferase involved in cell wall biosynthesis
MKILITNHGLVHRSGTELYVRDLTAALIARGHTIYIYSPMLGRIAEECRALGAAVTDNISELEPTPDIIHGHHHHTVIAAALRFPTTPIVYVCHGVTPWQEKPLRLSTIKKYVAVSNLTRTRIAQTTGIDIQEVELVSNFVNLKKFKKKRSTSHLPKKALLFGNHWNVESTQYNYIKKACERFGISSVDSIGLESGKITARPEAELTNYDIVFAVGRSAIEAMATGCAVILADLNGIGGLVTSSNFDSLLSMNFGLEATRNNLLTVNSVYANLILYNRKEAEKVATRVRLELDENLAVSKWESIYASVIQSPETDFAGVTEGVVAYIDQLNTQLNERYRFRTILFHTLKKLASVLPFIYFWI